MPPPVSRRSVPVPLAQGESDGEAARGVRAGFGAVVLVLLALLAAVALLASVTGPHDSGRAIEAMAALAAGGLPALLWLAAAAGLGRVASPLLLPRRRSADDAGGLAALDRLLLEVASGVCLLAAADAALGRVGLAEPWLLWPLTVLLAGAALWPRRAGTLLGIVRSAPPGTAWTLLAIVPAVAVLLVAAAAAPGWLWSSEFGGYDALAYHLELPRRWMEAGGIGPIDGNVYAFLPSHLEAAFLHLMVLLGDPLAAAIPSQFLHALLAILTAATLGRAAARSLPARDARPRGGLLAAGIFLGIPWVVIVASLAYNEMAAMLPLAAGLLRLLPPAESNGLEADPAPEPWRLGVLLGVLLGGAIGAKATAVGSVAAPLGLLLLAGGPTLPQRWFTRVLAAAIAACAALVMLLPWAIESTAASGSPLFPLFAATFPSPLWDAEQARIFAEAHGPAAAWGDRLHAIWDELLRLGIGPNPQPPSPWQPQWSLLGWFALAAIASLLSSPQRRAVGSRLLLVLAVQLLFWLLFTHAKSRFMLPAAVPAAAAVAIAIAGGPLRSGRSRGARGEIALANLALLAWCLLPAAVFLRERPIEGVPAPAAATGQIAAISGELHERLRADPRLSRRERAEVLAAAPPWTWINDSGLSGREGRVLLVGERRTFYLRRPFSAATVWERGELSRLARSHPDGHDAWRRELASQGFTMLLVDRGMIARWWRDGWWDPQLPPESIDRFLATLPSLRRFPYGLELFSLEGEAPRRTTP